MLGDRPGNGILFDEAKLDELTVEKPPNRAGASPWGRRRGAGLYEVGPSEPDELDLE
jgi:hypothetical protein